MKYKLINICGFGLTGCTAQADLLAEFNNFRAILQDKDRNKGVLKAPVQEFGIVKTIYSFGGPIIEAFFQQRYSMTKQELHNSILGDELPERIHANESEMLHLSKRSLMNDEIGESYTKIVYEALEDLPDTLDSNSLEELLVLMSDAMHKWVNGVYNHIAQESNNHDLVLGLKNDPPGFYPILSSIIPGCLTTAILRNPFDRTHEYLRFYQQEFSNENITNVCTQYADIMELTIRQIKLYREQLEGKYLVHDFESFVTNHEHQRCYVERTLGICESPNQAYFEPKVSAKNTNFYDKFNHEQRTIIHDICSAKYREFRRFLTTEGLFLY